MESLLTFSLWPFQMESAVCFLPINTTGWNYSRMLCKSTLYTVLLASLLLFAQYSSVRMLTQALIDTYIPETQLVPRWTISEDLLGESMVLRERQAILSFTSSPSSY